MKRVDPTIGRATLRLFMRAGMQHKRIFWLSMLNPLGTICVSTLTPLFIGKALAALSNPHGHPEHYISYIISSAVVGLLLNRIGFKQMMLFQALTMKDLHEQAMRALLNRSIGFHNNNVGGKLVSDALDFPSAFSQLSNAVFNGFVPFGIIMITGAAVIFTESWVLGLFILAMVVSMVGWGLYDMRVRAPLRARRHVVTKNVTAHLADAILNAQTVKTFAREDDELSRNDTLSTELLRLRLRDWSSAARAGNNRIAVLLTLQVAFVLLAIHLVRNDPALLGIGIFAFSFTVTLSNRLFEVNTLFRTVEEAMLQASSMTEILLQEPEIVDRPKAAKLKVREAGLELRDVTFRYEDSHANDSVFAKLNLAVRPGEKIGLVGPSGGGKSTLTRLLLRFEDINGGAITIDGQNIAEVTQASLRDAISYVPQEPLLFHRTIRENIAYGKPSARLADVKRAAHLAHADEFIEQLKDKYDTTVGERGVKLSGGQRQRVAIARAILKNAPILILDEATSALDSESEVLIQDALWKLMQDRTAIVIAHRLSTIQKMDRIIVLNNGQILEEGTHHQLLKHKGLYAQLWAHQSGGFIED